MSADCFLGIDVGTGSARAGLFDPDGRMLGSASIPIRMWRPETDFVEQSSEDIWNACGEAARTCLRLAAAAPDRVGGVGFDATCSLVALDGEDRPVTVSPTGRDEQNVIVWMDHRAATEARRINELGHEVLQYVGSRVSPEMQSPKLAWLHSHLPEAWTRTARYLDLCDFLTYRATGVDTRSLCSTVCKWTYLGHEDGRAGSVGRWDESYWRQIGLGELVDESYARIGTIVRPMGEPLGGGLTPEAARTLGLEPGVAVAVSIIDAHAGGLGMIGASLDGHAPVAAELDRRLALIGGTSSCHMAVSAEPRFIDGVWGPYFGAMVPGLWLTEGGQSATGALVDHVIETHGASDTLREQSRESGRSVYELLNERLETLAGGQHSAALTSDLHVLPDHHGNRSPRADPFLRGMVSGLRLSATLDDLALLYLATVQAIAHGTRHIIETLNGHGYAIDTLLACGGGTKNPLFLREHADVTGCRLVLPREPEAVLLGSAILGAVAAGRFASVLEAMASMNHAGRTLTPDAATARYHDAKHAVFLRMYDDQMAYRSSMQRVGCSPGT
ncbi:MAG: FGGY-family carbohydrate kinase [Planctomycetota bacterium]|jgi:FGGY-family pentulose kinase